MTGEKAYISTEVMRCYVKRAHAYKFAMRRHTYNSVTYLSHNNSQMNAIGNSAWEWNVKRQQYYYHNYLIEQPDLNYRNPLVRTAVKVRCLLTSCSTGCPINVVSTIRKYERKIHKPYVILFRLTNSLK